MKVNVQKLLNEFSDILAKETIEIYNEFSLQHELGLFLRHSLPGCRVLFERPTGSFFSKEKKFIKKEIDICVTSPDKTSLFMAIELKYPRNGQHPEQMFSFCKDILFAEQLKAAGFESTAVAIFAEDRLFYEGGGEGIYKYFRAKRPLTGRVAKPTGSKDTEVILSGNYSVSWNPIIGNLKYTLISI